MSFKYFEFLSVNQGFFFRSSKGSSSHCSEDSGGSDSCSVTVRDSYFYVRVFAHSQLSNAKLEIRGGNIESVEEVDVVDQTTLPSVSKFLDTVFSHIVATATILL